MKYARYTQAASQQGLPKELLDHGATKQRGTTKRHGEKVWTSRPPLRRSMLRRGLLRGPTIAKASRAAWPVHAQRWLCSGTDESKIRSTVLRLFEQQPGGDLTTDLDRKFNFLHACEKEFGMLTSHVELTRVNSVEDAVQVWEDKFAELDAKRLAEENHYSKTAPPNVRIFGKSRNNPELQEFWREFSQKGRLTRARNAVLEESSD